MHSTAQHATCAMEQPSSSATGSKLSCGQKLCRGEFQGMENVHSKGLPSGDRGKRMCRGPRGSQLHARSMAVEATGGMAHAGHAAAAGQRNRSAHEAGQRSGQAWWSNQDPAGKKGVQAARHASTAGIDIDATRRYGQQMNRVSTHHYLELVRLLNKFLLLQELHGDEIDSLT